MTNMVRERGVQDLIGPERGIPYRLGRGEPGRIRALFSRAVARLNGFAGRVFGERHWAVVSSTMSRVARLAKSMLPF